MENKQEPTAGLRVEGPWTLVGAGQVDLEAVVGGRVRALREAQGLSQAQLGQRMGELGFPMEQPTVYKLEKGARPIRLNELAALCIIFDVPIESMWRGADDDDPEYHEALKAWADAMDRYSGARVRLAAARHHAAEVAAGMTAARAAEAEAEKEFRAAEQVYASTRARVEEIGRRPAAKRSRRGEHRS